MATEIDESTKLIKELTVAIGVDNHKAQGLLGNLAALLGRYQGRAEVFALKIKFFEEVVKKNDGD